MSRSPKRAKATTRVEQEPDSPLPLDVDVANRLIREIISEVHPPGSWLREQEIAERFQVSRSPVREALRHVAKAGFIAMHPWRGAQVIELTRAETSDVFDVLEAIYAIVARSAAQRISDDKFAILRRHLEEGEKLIQPGQTREDRVAWSFTLGRLIARWGASRTTHDMIVQAGNLAMWQHRFMQADDKHSARSLDLHRVLVSALEERDGETAALAARTIVSLARDAVMPCLPEDAVVAPRARRAKGQKQS